MAVLRIVKTENERSHASMVCMISVMTAETSATYHGYARTAHCKRPVEWLALAVYAVGMSGSAVVRAPNGCPPYGVRIH